MQDNSLESSTSISQLLRESYLAETRHPGNTERSRSEASPHTFHYGSTSGASEEVAGQDDLPDLSAFLSQEELDESVNLARQAIDQDPLEKQDEQQTHVHYSSDQVKNCGKTVSNKQVAQSTVLPTSDNSLHSNFCLDHVTETKGSKESTQDLKKQQFGSEAESKKEFLNKAADFIEELSSLFKAHNSKRIRPKTCKNYRSKLESKNKAAQEGSPSFPKLSEKRERPSIPVPQDLDNKAEHILEKANDLQEANLEAINQLESTELTTETAPTSLYFEEPLGQPPHFTQKLKSREVPEGTKVQLDCIVVGIPAPEVRWYCEGKELENSPDIHIIQSGDLHSLIIVEAFEEDTGRYSCFASNIYGTDSTSAEIYIEGASSSESEGEISTEEMDQVQKPTDISLNAPSPATNTTTTHQETPKVPSTVGQPVYQSQSPTNYLQGLDGRPLIAAPVFTKMLQDISASEGQLVVFECRVKGAPSPKVEWYREGTLIQDSPDFRILQKKPRSMTEPEEICTLVIAEVFSEDSGSFTCTASNKYGTVSSIACLIVKGTEDHSNTAALHTMSSINLIAAEQHPTRLIPSLPVVDQPTKPKLEGVLVNHNEPRSSSKIGLRVHFKLPEDDKGSETSSEDGGVSANQVRPHYFQERINGQTMKIPEPTSPTKEPPPVLAKPKLDPTQLQQLHNQVLLEQQHLQQPSPPSPRELPFNTGILNSATSFNQQSTSTIYKQAKVSPSQTFSYTRPKQFLVSQNTTPPINSPSSSPVPTFSSVPQGTQRTMNKENFVGSPPPIQTRSPGGFTSQSEQPLASPKESVLPPLLLSISSLNQFQPHIVLPTPVSPISRIQNPVAFLSSVLPSLPSVPPTNAMGLPRSAPAAASHGLMKKNLKPLHLATDDYIHNNKVAVVRDLQRKMHFKEDVCRHSSQQRTTYDEKLTHRLQGPSNDSPVFNYTTQDVSKEYKISSFEQRLMNEIEFRLERTPVDESDDEIQHDEIPTGKCIAPIFDKRLKHFRVMEGSPVTFTCKIVGIPIPKVYWFKDGKQISKKNEHCKMKREGDGTCSLHIEATTNDDDGNYTIMAANPQGRISCSGHLMVQTVPMRGRLTTTQSHRARSRVQEGDKEPLQDRFFRPYFLQAPGDMVAHEGRLCRLDCKVSGLPTPDLMWLLNGKPVLPDSTHKMLVRETGVHSLLIDPLTQNDAGTYTCIATNKTGQNSFSLELSVVAKEVKKAPAFLEKLQNCGVPEGHPVRLEGRVIGMPPPIFYWKKDNETIPANRERMSMHQDTTGYVCLLIQPAKKVDAGWYTLSAKNEAGIVSCTARLDIYAQWHQQIPLPIKFRPSGGRYANLTGQGLDIFSAFSAVENPKLFSSSSQSVVESEEL
ncbi:myopalladin [Malaclemys terrapin pileata]|uniref:myopalladin n=1 Tax=Malaclemys terrapin pileata TaxID=2991368 RepID=UPI0023A8FEF4|nr:myopalladin [Malaclemys terrapin pileata]XP_053891177.1 myopalladin [Malaclemys terrapin pileata]XP_053891178.1 myopalladin [Malaclemys terrapin pileata]XP_053891179.1 myopalladin [Malaclemys terrapin pileata]